MTLDVRRKTRPRSLLGKTGAAVKNGFTLIEVLIATAILSIAIVALANLFLLAIRKNAAASERTRLTARAQSKLEQLLALPYADPSLINGTDVVTIYNGFTNQKFTRSWTVQNNWPEGGCKTVTVTVLGFKGRGTSGYFGKRQVISVSGIKVQSLGGLFQNN